MTTRKPGNMGEHRFGSFRMMFGRPNAGAMGRAQNHRAAQPSLRPVAQPGGVIHQLIDAGIQESHELDFADRAQALRRHPDAEAADQQIPASGVSITRSAPKRFCKPSVARKTPPFTPTSSPKHDDIGIILQGRGRAPD